MSQQLKKLIIAISIVGVHCLLSPASASNVYVWSKNQVVEAPTADSIQAQTALATASDNRIFLSFLDANYHRVNKRWIAWPRRVRLFTSDDGGATFKTQPDLDPVGGDEHLVCDSSGNVLCTYLHYYHDETPSPVKEHVVLRQLSPADRIIYESHTPRSSSSIISTGLTAGAGGVIHLIANEQSFFPHRDLLMYSRSADEGDHWTSKLRMDAVGVSPKAVDCVNGLYIITTSGFCRSSDEGRKFSEKSSHVFGDRLINVAVSPNRKTIYVVGDSKANGLFLSTSSDDGSWQQHRVDDAASAQAWRYPALFVEGSGRIQIVWMDDRTGYGALYHAFSDDGGATFSANERISDEPFPFPKDAPYPPPGTQDGSWVGNYLALTSVSGKLVAAWSDQRSGKGKSTVYVSIGTEISNPNKPSDHKQSKKHGKRKFRSRRSH